MYCSYILSKTIKLDVAKFCSVLHLFIILNDINGRISAGGSNSFLKENTCIQFRKGSIIYLQLVDILLSLHSCSLRVCQGLYDSALVSAWEDWDGKHGSENDHPKEFPENQVCFLL